MPNLLERDELKYEDDGRAGEVALMAIGDEIIEADKGRGIELGFGVCSCSCTNLSYSVSPGGDQVEALA